MLYGDPAPPPASPLASASPSRPQVSSPRLRGRRFRALSERRRGEKKAGRERRMASSNDVLEAKESGQSRSTPRSRPSGELTSTWSLCSCSESQLQALVVSKAVSRVESCITPVAKGEEQDLGRRAPPGLVGVEVKAKSSRVSAC